MTAPKFEFVAVSAPTVGAVVLSGLGVDAAGSPPPPPPVGWAVDAASRRQDEPAALTRLVRLAPASTPLRLAVLGYLNAGLARHWREAA